MPTTGGGTETKLLSKDLPDIEVYRFFFEFIFKNTFVLNKSRVFWY